MPLLGTRRLLLLLGLACSPGLQPPPAGQQATSAPAPRPAAQTYGTGPRPAATKGKEPRDRVERKDGSRVKYSWIEMPDGLRVISYGPWDSQLRVRCSREQDEAGVDRCFPDLPHGPIRFLDHRCAQPVFDTDTVPLLAPGAMVVSRLRRNCDQTETRAFRVGVRVDRAPLWAGSGADDCRESGLPEAGHTLYRIAEALPASTFVRYRRRTLPGVGPLRPWVLDGDDGSVLEWGWLDLESGVECRPKIASDGQLRCLPEVHESGLPFEADPECREEAILIDSNCKPNAFAQTRAPGCPARVSVRWRVPLDRLYMRWDGTCKPAPRWSGRKFGLGKEIAPDHFPPFEERMTGGAARLQPVFVGAGDWEGLQEFQDTQLDVRCWPGAMWRRFVCVPTRIRNFVATFADPSCQTPLAEIRGHQCAPSHVVLEDPQALHERRAYDLGEIHQGAVYRLSRHTCQPQPVEAGAQYLTLRPLPPGVFAQIPGHWTSVGQ